MYSIPFPNIDPVLFQFGWLAVRWYALSYIAGLLLGWWYILKLLRDATLWRSRMFAGKAPVTEDDIGDLVLWATIGILLGGRLGYVILYGFMFCGLIDDGSARTCASLPQAYIDNPLEMFAIWKGGMSFHGGLAGVVIAIILFSLTTKVDPLAFDRAVRKDKDAADAIAQDTLGNHLKRFWASLTDSKSREDNSAWRAKMTAGRQKLREITQTNRTRRIDMFKLGDLVAMAAPIGLFFGRIANFINGELWGKPSDAPWAVIFCNPPPPTVAPEHWHGCPDRLAGPIARHPSQLYEAFLEGAVLFFVLRFVLYRFRLHERPGLITAIFLTGYGIARATAELFRESDSPLYGPFSMGMLLSFPMWAAAAFFFWYAYRQRPAS